MAEIKWIKVTTSIFDDEKIKLIDAMPERDTIFNIWIKLLVQAGKTNANGYVFLVDNIAYTEEMLSTIFNRPINSIRLALQTLSKFKMIDIDEQNLIKITNWEKHQNVDGMEKVREQNRLRKQKQRAKQNKIFHSAKDEICESKNDCPSMSRDSHAIEEERDKDIEREKEIDIEKEEEVEAEDKDKDKEKIAAAKTLSDVVKVFNNNIHMITPLEAERIKDWLMKIDAEVVIKAIEEAVYYNKRSMGYINAVLNSWLNNNLKSLQDVEGYLRDRELKKRGDKGGSTRENNDSSTSEIYDFSKYGG